MLREFLATGGYTNILPSDDKCISLLWLYRRQKINPPPGFDHFPLKPGNSVSCPISPPFPMREESSGARRLSADTASA